MTPAVKIPETCSFCGRNKQPEFCTTCTSNPKYTNRFKLDEHIAAYQQYLEETDGNNKRNGD